MSELDEVKAGKYELVAVSWDRITSKPGDPLDFTRYRKGDVVDLNVDEARRLVRAGAVVKPGQRQAAQAAAALAQLQNALAQLTPEQRAAFLAANESVAQPTPAKKAAAKKAVAKVNDAPVTVTPAAPAAPAPQGDSEAPSGADESATSGS